MPFGRDHFRWFGKKDGGVCLRLNFFANVDCTHSHAFGMSETWLSNEERVDVENFNCVSQYRRPSIKRGGGVGIYHNVSDSQHAVTVCDDAYLRRNSQYVSEAKSAHGDICAARCTLPNGKQIVMVTVYISVNKKVEDIMDFLLEALLAYTEGGSKLLKKRYHELPLILGGDFNIQFDTDKGLRLVKFLKEELNLDLVSGNTLGTTRHGTTIDAIFSRFVNHVTSDVHVSYFSYHKPIVTVLNNDVTVNEIINVQNDINSEENQFTL